MEASTPLIRNFALIICVLGAGTTVVETRSGRIVTKTKAIHINNPCGPMQVKLSSSVCSEEQW